MLDYSGWTQIKKADRYERPLDPPVDLRAERMERALEEVWTDLDAIFDVLEGYMRPTDKLVALIAATSPAHCTEAQAREVFSELLASMKQAMESKAEDKVDAEEDPDVEG